MGGFFYDSADYSVYPDATEKKMILRYADTEVILCDDLASDINIKDGFVYYRKLNERVISQYSISDRTTAKLPLKNVGQFIICEDELYYIDLSSSSLIAFDFTTKESNVIVHSGVSSFIIIGNNVIFLDDDHTLCEMNLNDHSQTTIGKNITGFSYNGTLWIQNNEKVYTKFLNKKSIKDVTFDIPCKRLLGVSGTHAYIESTDGIYTYSIETGTSQKVADGIFIGASDGKILIYDLPDGIYRIIAIE